MDLPLQPNWGSATVATGATALLIGSGEANTTTIVSAYGSGRYAAQYCAQDISGGSEDWFLPSIDELQEIYTVLKLNAVGNLKDDCYWSSTENDASTAFALDFTDGSSSAHGKGTYFLVRSIRAFE